MSYSVFENTLAKLLTSKKYLSDFQKNPQLVLAKLDLTQDEKLALINTDPSQLSVAAHSFQTKRAKQQSHSHGSLIKIFFQRFLKNNL